MENQDDIQLIFIEEAKNCLNDIFEKMNLWSENLQNNDLIREILNQLHTIKGGSRLVQQPLIGDAAHKMEEVFKTIQEKKISVGLSLHGKLLFALDFILSMVEALEAKESMPEGHKIIENIEVDIATHAVGSEVEPDILKIFLLEAEEVLTELKNDLPSWKAHSEDPQFYHSAHRLLHTLKGAARIAGFSALGDYAHVLEDVIAVTQNRKLDPSNNFFSVLSEGLDEIDAFLASITASESPNPLNFKLLSEYAKQNKIVLESVPPALAVSNLRAKEIKSFKKKGLPDTVRLETSVLEKLSNLAISANISSAHISQQLNLIRLSIEESGMNIAQVQELLRDIKLDKKSDEQPEMGVKHQDFDIVELDRYSSLERTVHQLNSLLSQLASYHESLVKKIFTCESWMVEQKKSTRSIEENLIHTRLVPFETLKNRFERIVRQVSSELNKHVEIVYKRVEGELDRNVLDRILSPIEHLIRNAIDHGIESPSERVSAGKKETGTIELSLVRKGSEVLIEMSDDGQGLDVEKIYESAVKKGLITAGIRLSEKETLNLVMTPGFSTRDNVTQISGRGIGMDIVNSEIKKLGGTFLISSERHKGAKFTLRLPFTLSLNKVLIFVLNRIVYALPLSSLYGVTRIQKKEFMERLKNNDKEITYMGKKYLLVSLEKIFGQQPGTSKEHEQAPLLLIGQEEGIALAVDRLIASREIVIKSAGPQLKYIPIISGATLLEDGTVVLVLDPLMLLHQIHEQKRILIKVETKTEQAPLIMVIDDSLTVRKVTEGLLTRHQFKVVTAVDGLEALNKMKQAKPNVVLLDIEMPNMDGYELLQLMKSDINLKTIPVVMITSRAGEKHKKKALELGASLYLTKPFKQDELIEAISQLIGADQ